MPIQTNFLNPLQSKINYRGEIMISITEKAKEIIQQHFALLSSHRYEALAGVLSSCLISGNPKTRIGKVSKTKKM